MLFDGECVLMQKRVEPKTEKKRPRGAFSDEFEENSLYEALRAQRAELAKRESVPAYRHLFERDARRHGGESAALALRAS